MKVKVALAGKTGAGKTTVARYLQEEYGFHACRTGQRCRELAMEFFGTESKYLLNKITDLFRELEPGVWLKVALRNVPLTTDRVVIDSIRFPEDYHVAKQNGFQVWRIECSQSTRAKRLTARGQEFDLTTDEDHLSEIALDNVPCDAYFENDACSVQDLCSKIDDALRRLLF